MEGMLDAVTKLGKYTPAFIRRKLMSGRFTYICIIAALCFVSVITLGIFQTSLKTNREQIDNARYWREIAGLGRLNKPQVEFNFNSNDQDTDTGIGNQRNLKEDKSSGHRGKNEKDGNDIAARGQPGNKQVKNAREKQPLFKSNSKLLHEKGKNQFDKKFVEKETVKELGVIPADNEKKDIIQKKSNDKIHDTFEKEPLIREENEEEKEQQSLIKALSDLLAKLEDNGLNTDLEEKLFAYNNKNNHHLPSFDPKQYPQTVDIQQLLSNFVQTGVLPDNPINKWIYQPIINPTHVCDQTVRTSKVFLLFIVKTSPENFDKRKTIRKTWADPMRFPNIRTVFSIGVPKSSGTMKKLRLESTKYKDILLMDYKDSYYNLTLKTTSGINWAVAHCNKAEFVVSIDDDIYLATDFLTLYLQSLSESQADRLYMGHVYEKTLPVRKETANEYTQKWIIYESEYSFRTYPDYVFGGCIVMSMRTVVEMYTIIPYTKTIVMEDVYLGILASRLGIAPIHTDLIDVYVTYSNSEKFKTLIASHYYKSSHMLKKAWECHLSLVNKDVEKSAYCTYLKDELEALRKHVDNILHWINLSNNAV
ncbi:lactosylceramide 1,3-N-acetyl-beta-D-glucosaminyltransferase-like [Ylistrum balloti]|uniref:lactosylceramide 1,3-N-acetyl-beta-D-glucosaminyltransferase-like n=1 Tax=Ylistrum balloti TaxID=509963 RepID=UPI002905D345|nr:lactosylceramide 1,3-N-acetyl-beta-D-glucosaminyltransferase-like [Ylistrum balloti]